MGSSASDAFADILAAFEKQKKAGEYDAALDEFMADQVVPVWKDNSPDDTGAYKDSVGVTQRAHEGEGQVGAEDEAANIVEYGSINSPEYAPRAKTEAHFNTSRGGEAL